MPREGRSRRSERRGPLPSRKKETSTRREEAESEGSTEGCNQNPVLVPSNIVRNGTSDVSKDGEGVFEDIKNLSYHAQRTELSPSMTPQLLDRSVIEVVAAFFFSLRDNRLQLHVRTLLLNQLLRIRKQASPVQ